MFAVALRQYTHGLDELSQGHGGLCMIVQVKTQAAETQIFCPCSPSPVFLLLPLSFGFFKCHVWRMEKREKEQSDLGVFNMFQPLPHLATSLLHLAVRRRKSICLTWCPRLAGGHFDQKHLLSFLHPVSSCIVLASRALVYHSSSKVCLWRESEFVLVAVLKPLEMCFLNVTYGSAKVSTPWALPDLEVRNNSRFHLCPLQWMCCSYTWHRIDSQ